MQHTTKHPCHLREKHIPAMGYRINRYVSVNVTGAVQIYGYSPRCRVGNLYAFLQTRDIRLCCGKTSIPPLSSETVEHVACYPSCRVPRT